MIPGKALSHGSQRLRVVVDQNELPSVFQASRAGRTAAREKIQHHLAGVRRSLDDASQNAQRFLGRVTCLLPAIGGHNGMPPGIGRGFAQRRLFRPHQAGRHVGNALDGIIIKRVGLRVPGVPEDIIVLGGPLRFCARAIIVGPDDLIKEALPSEDLIEQHLAVMHFAVIDVKVQAAVGLEQAISLAQARFDKGNKVIENVAVGLRTHLHCCIAVAGKAGTVAVLGTFGAQLGAALRMPGVEGWVDIDEVHRGRRQRLQGSQVISKVNAVIGHGVILAEDQWVGRYKFDT